MELVLGAIGLVFVGACAAVALLALGFLLAK